MTGKLAVGNICAPLQYNLPNDGLGILAIEYVATVDGEVADPDKLVTATGVTELVLKFCVNELAVGGVVL